MMKGLDVCANAQLVEDVLFKIVFHRMRQASMLFCLSLVNCPVKGVFSFRGPDS